MNAKELHISYQTNKAALFKYLGKIRNSSSIDIYSIINPTLVNNPLISEFAKSFFLKSLSKDKKLKLFLINTCKFYIKNFYKLFVYCIMTVLFKLFYKKKLPNLNDVILIDVFFLVNKIIEDNSFKESYFNGLYDVLNDVNQKYIFLPRLYNMGKNPFTIIKLLKILNKDKRYFLFEFHTVKIVHVFELAIYILNYPFKTLRLLQNEKNIDDKVFNKSLLKEISNASFESFTRYIQGKSLVKYKGIKKIYSWCEFQVIERSFNYAIRKSNSNIQIFGCQLAIFSEIFFHMKILDMDFLQGIAPHKVIVNGKFYLEQTEYIKYILGPSLRYKDIYSYKMDVSSQKDEVLLLGSIVKKDIVQMLEYVSTLNKNILFKPHPALEIEKYKNHIGSHIQIVDSNIYELFQKSAVAVIAPASGTAVEAVSCGISVIIIASDTNLTANTLVEYGKGKIWDIVYEKNEIKDIYEKLQRFRLTNFNEIEEMAIWYKTNFFNEPTKKNIINGFELE